LNVRNLNIRIIAVFYKYYFNYYPELRLHYNDKSHNQKSNKISIKSEDQLSEEEMIIYNKLKSWRSEKSQELKLPSYIIFHNTHLMSIAKFKPSNVEELEHVNGLGKTKIEKFGIEIIEVLENA